MDNTEFYNSFRFASFRFNRYHYHHTDSTFGSEMNYLGYIKDGRARIVSSDCSIEMQSGEWFFIPKGLSYQSYWESDGYVEWDSYGFEYYPDVSDFSLQKISLTDESAEIAEMLRKSVGVDGDSLRDVGILYLLLGSFAANMERESRSVHYRIEAKMRELILADPTLDIPQIAEKCGISTSGLYAIFKKEFGMTPNSFRIKVICEKAERLLCNTDIPIEEISDILGFSSSSYFRKVLMAELGKTPSAIRQSAKL